MQNNEQITYTLKKKMTSETHLNQHGKAFPEFLTSVVLISRSKDMSNELNSQQLFFFYFFSILAS